MRLSGDMSHSVAQFALLHNLKFNFKSTKTLNSDANLALRPLLWLRHPHCLADAPDRAHGIAHTSRLIVFQLMLNQVYQPDTAIVASSRCTLPCCLQWKVCNVKHHLFRLTPNTMITMIKSHTTTRRSACCKEFVHIFSLPASRLRWSLSPLALELFVLWESERREWNALKLSPSRMEPQQHPGRNCNH